MDMCSLTCLQNVPTTESATKQISELQPCQRSQNGTWRDALPTIVSQNHAEYHTRFLQVWAGKLKSPSDELCEQFGRSLGHAAQQWWPHSPRQLKSIHDQL